MRFVALALVFLSLPLFISLLRNYPDRRPWALTALGLMLFIGGALKVEVSIIGWPMWNGIVRGILISPAEMLAIALISTRRGKLSARPFWIVMAIYGSVLLLSMLPASVRMASFFAVWQFGRVMLLFAAVAGECYRPDSRSGLLAGFALGLMLQAGYVIQQKLSGAVQAMGTMSHQNVLGMLVELALLSLIGGLLAGNKSKLLKVGIVAGLIVIAGGGSRGAMAFAGGGIAVLILLSLLRGVTPVKMKVVGMGALALVVVVPLGMLTLKDRFGSSSITTQEDQRGRFEIAARAMAADHPFGVGANLYVPVANTQGYAARAGVAWNFANRSAPVHNAYLLARAETGWAGQIAFVLMLSVPVLIGLRTAFAPGSGVPGETALAGAIAVAVNIVHNNYEYAIFTYNVMAMLLVTMGLIAAQVRAVALAQQAGRSRRPVPPPGAAVPIGMHGDRLAR